MYLASTRAFACAARTVLDVSTTAIGCMDWILSFIVVFLMWKM